jgi:hypothetical protein
MTDFYDWIGQLAAAGSVDDLSGADRGEVAIALVGEHERVRSHPPDTGRDRRCAPPGLQQPPGRCRVGQGGHPWQEIRRHPHLASAAQVAACRKGEERRA